MQMNFSIEVPDRLIPDNDDELIAFSLDCYVRMLDAILAVGALQTNELTHEVINTIEETRWRAGTLRAKYLLTSDL